MKKTKPSPQIFAALAGTMLVIVIGFHVGWASPALPKLLEDTSVPVTREQASLTVSLLSIGSALGPLLSIATVDRWGRKATMLLLSIPFFISSILIAFAQNYWWYYVGRTMCGLTCGVTWVVVPIYIGEIAEDKFRGGCGILIGVMRNLGYVLAYSIGPWASKFVLAAFGAAIPVVFLSIFIWMPETPYFYVIKGKPELARESLQWLRGTMNVSEEMEVVKKNVEFDLQNAGTLNELFTDKGNRKALIIVLGVISASELAGMAAVSAYSTLILNEVGSDITPSTSVILTGVVQLVISIISVFLVDRIGKKPTLLGSMLLTTLFSTGLAVYFHLRADGFDVSGISWLPATAIISFTGSYSMGLGVMPMCINSEIFPCNFKAYGIILVCMYCSGASAGVLELYSAFAYTYGIHFAFYIFVACTVFFMFFVFFYMFETKGKSLGEIQQILKK